MYVKVNNGQQHENSSVENIDYKLYPTLLYQNVAHCHTLTL